MNVNTVGKDGVVMPVKAMCTICVSTVGVDGVVSTLFIMLRGNTYIYELQAGVRRCEECHMYVV